MIKTIIKYDSNTIYNTDNISLIPFASNEFIFYRTTDTNSIKFANTIQFHTTVL